MKRPNWHDQHPPTRSFETERFVLTFASLQAQEASAMNDE